MEKIEKAMGGLFLVRRSRLGYAKGIILSLLPWPTCTAKDLFDTGPFPPELFFYFPVKEVFK